MLLDFFMVASGEAIPSSWFLKESPNLKSRINIVNNIHSVEKLWHAIWLQREMGEAYWIKWVTTSLIEEFDYYYGKCICKQECMWTKVYMFHYNYAMSCSLQHTLTANSSHMAAWSVVVSFKVWHSAYSSSISFKSGYLTQNVMSGWSFKIKLTNKQLMGFRHYKCCKTVTFDQAGFTWLGLGTNITWFSLGSKTAFGR